MAVVAYFAAHPDDELLIMGCSIIEHVKAGHDVHVVLVTDGSGSNVRTSSSFTTWLGRTPNKAEFSERRIAEFHESCRRMGVPYKNRHVIGLVDGQTTFNQVFGVVTDFLAKYPDARLKGHSWVDAHKDHFHIGKALKKAYDDGLVQNNDVRWLLNRQYSGQVPFPKYGQTGPQGVDPNYLVAPYKRYHKTYDNWGIGYRSTAGLFNQLVSDPRSWTHADNWNSEADRQAAIAWLASKGLNL